MIEAFKESPLLLLFVVSAIGYLVGKISLRGAQLGSAAVLFVGLGFGALDPELSVPQIIIVLGLAMFVYTIGLSSGAGFFHTFKKHGLTNSLFILGVIGISAGSRPVSTFCGVWMPPPLPVCFPEPIPTPRPWPDCWI